MKNVKVGEIIRRQENEEPWLVVMVSTQGFLIANLTDDSKPRALYVLLPGDYDHWKPDKETEQW